MIKRRRRYKNVARVNNLQWFVSTSFTVLYCEMKSRHQHTFTRATCVTLNRTGSSLTPNQTGATPENCTQPTELSIGCWVWARTLGPCVNEPSASPFWRETSGERHLKPEMFNVAFIFFWQFKTTATSVFSPETLIEVTCNNALLSSEDGRTLTVQLESSLDVKSLGRSQTSRRHLSAPWSSSPEGVRTDAALWLAAAADAALWLVRSSSIRSPIGWNGTVAPLLQLASVAEEFNVFVSNLQAAAAQRV